ncbi:MAG: SLC13 family permease [Opitutales bacterium]
MNLRIKNVPWMAAVPIVAAGAAALLMPGMGPVPALVALTVALLASGLWPEYVTALIFFTLCMLLHAGTAVEVFSGFSSAAFWLILAGMFLGQAVTRTNLGERIAGYFVRWIPEGRAAELGGAAALGLFMAFLMPSAMGRVLLMLPIFQGFARRLGHVAGTRAFTGIVLTGTLSTFLPAMSILPANIPNMVLAGAAEAMHLPMPNYGHYLALHFPVLGLLQAVLIAVVVGLMYRSSGTRDIAARLPRAALASGETRRAWSKEEIRVALVLGLCLVMWCTDAWHGISPAWVGMVGAIVCLLPGIGVLDPQKSIRELNLGSLFYVAAIISIGAIVHASGMGAKIADALLTVLPLSHGASFGNFSLLGLLSTIMGPICTTPGIPAVLTPLAQHLAEASGMSVSAVLMTQVLGFSTVIFPFQTAPLLVGLRMMDLPLRESSRVVLLIALFTVLLLWPLEYVVWKLMGFI